MGTGAKTHVPTVISPQPQTFAKSATQTVKPAHHLPPTVLPVRWITTSSLIQPVPPIHVCSPATSLISRMAWLAVPAVPLVKIALPWPTAPGAIQITFYCRTCVSLNAQQIKPQFPIQRLGTVMHAPVLVQPVLLSHISVCPVWITTTFIKKWTTASCSVPVVLTTMGSIALSVQLNVWLAQMQPFASHATLGTSSTTQPVLANVLLTFINTKGPARVACLLVWLASRLLSNACRVLPLLILSSKESPAQRPARLGTTETKLRISVLAVKVLAKRAHRLATVFRALLLLSLTTTFKIHASSSVCLATTPMGSSVRLVQPGASSALKTVAKCASLPSIYWKESASTIVELITTLQTKMFANKNPLLKYFRKTCPHASSFLFPSQFSPFSLVFRWWLAKCTDMRPLSLDPWCLLLRFSSGGLGWP